MRFNRAMPSKLPDLIGGGRGPRSNKLGLNQINTGAYSVRFYFRDPAFLYSLVLLIPYPVGSYIF